MKHTYVHAATIFPLCVYFMSSLEIIYTDAALVYNICIEVMTERTTEREKLYDKGILE